MLRILNKVTLFKKVSTDGTKLKGGHTGLERSRNPMAVVLRWREQCGGTKTDREEGRMTLGSSGVASERLPRTAGNHWKSGDGHGTEFPVELSGTAWPCKSAALISWPPELWESTFLLSEATLLRQALDTNATLLAYLHLRGQGSDGGVARTRQLVGKTFEESQVLWAIAQKVHQTLEGTQRSLWSPEL